MTTESISTTTTNGNASTTNTTIGVAKGKKKNHQILYNEALGLTIFMLIAYLSPKLRGDQIDSMEKVNIVWDEFQKVTEELGPSLPAMLDFRWNDGSMWQSAWIDEYVVRKMHFGILPVVSWLILAPIQLSKSLRTKYPIQHRYCGFIFFATSTCISIGATILITKGKVMGYPHWLALVLNTFKVSYFMITLFQALRYARKRNIPSHQVWVLRHLAMGYTASFQRVLLIVIGPLLHAYQVIPDLNRIELKVYYNITTILGFLVPLAVVEYYINNNSRNNNMMMSSSKQIKTA